MPISVGLVSTSSGQRLWPESEKNQAKEFLNKAANFLEDLNFDVFKYPKIVCTPQEGINAAKEIINKGAEVLICYIGGWSYSSAIVALANEINIPIILWTNSRPDTAGLVGAGIAKGALDEIGIKYNFVYGNFDQEKSKYKITQLVKGLSVRSRIKNSKFGLFGNRTFGMNTTVIDINQWKKRFNVEVECFDQIELLEQAKTANASEVSKAKMWMKNTFKLLQKDKSIKEVLTRSIRLYIAMLEIIKNHDLDFAAVRCLPELPRYYSTFCVANALLNATVDYKGKKESFVCACEADGNGALTMQILKNLTSSSVSFGDVRYINPDDGILVVCNCGSQALDFTSSYDQIHWLPQVGFQGEGGGLCSQYICKSGEVTLARISRISGEFVMLIVTGNCIGDVPREKLHETTWEWPHAFIKLNPDHNAFLKNVRSNHIHMVYGNIVSELVVACESMNIKPIIIS